MHFLFQTRGPVVEFKDLLSITFTQRSSAPRHQIGIWQCAKSSSRLRSPAYSRFIIPLPRRLMLFASPRQPSLFIILDDSCLTRSLKHHTENPCPPVSLRFGLVKVRTKSICGQSRPPQDTSPYSQRHPLGGLF